MRLTSPRLDLGRGRQVMPCAGRSVKKDTSSCSFEIARENDERARSSTKSSGLCGTASVWYVRGKRCELHSTSFDTCARSRRTKLALPAKLGGTTMIGSRRWRYT